VNGQSDVALDELRRIQVVVMMERTVEVRTDEELLVGVPGDPDALEALYKRYFDATVAFAVRRCSRPDEVHDLVAAVWLDVIRAAPRFDPSRGRAFPWILGIAANLVADQRRRFAREREALHRLAGRRVLDVDDVARLEDAIDASRAAHDVLVELAALPHGERAAVELIALEGLTPARAAEALGMQPAAVRMRLARARRKLRVALVTLDEAVR
jgi:RNA polymerase sigma-70 factor (ECF subfamily)